MGVDRSAAGNRQSKFRFVFHVHQYTGNVASTRVKGRDVGDRLRRVAAGSDASLIEISFHGVEVASGPFMQEIVKAARELKDRAIYSCLNDDVHHVLTLAETSTGRADV